MAVSAPNAVGADDLAVLLVDVPHHGCTRAEMVTVAVAMIAKRDREIASLRRQLDHV